MTTKFSSNSFISRMSYKNLNHSALRAMLVILLFALSIGNAWAGGGGNSTYKAQVNVSVASASPTGAGTVYVSTANNYPEGDNTKSTSTSTTAGVSQSKEASDAPTFTFYVKAVPNQGYYMQSWAFGSWTSAPGSTTTATSQSGTVKGTTGTATATAAATFASVKVTAAPADVNINAENPSATYPDAAGSVVGFTLNGSNATNDYTTGGEGDSRWVITAWPTRASSTNITFNYKFVGNGSYGADNRTIVKTVTLKGYVDETVKTCTLTAKYPNPKVIGGVNQEIFTTYKAAADQETVTKTAAFDVLYGDNANNFTAAFSGATGGGAWTITGISVDQANQKATVTYTFNGNKVPGVHQATLTLTANDCHGWNNTSAAGSSSAAITITATNEQESDYDARVIAADGVTELYKGAWATAWTTANTAANAGCTLQVLRNVTGGSLNANQTVTNTFTLDLNGKVLSAKYNGSIIYLNTAGKTLTIKDSKTGGRIENVNNAYAGAAYLSNVAAGNLILESGTLYCENKGASGRRAVGIYNQAGTTVTMNGGKIEVHGYNNSQGVLQTSNKNNNTSFTMNGGEIEVDGYQDIYGVSAPGKVNINDGTINVTATYNNCRGITLSAAASATAADCYWGTLTMKGGTINSTCTANADGTRSAYGVLFDCSNAAMGTAVATDGSHANKAASTGTIENATINVSTLGRYAYGVIAYGSYQSKTDHYDVIQIKNTKIDVTSQYYYTYGVYATGGVNSTHGAIYFANIELTDCDVTATTTKNHTAYAVWATTAANTIYKNVQPNYYGEYAGGATVTVNSGTYTANTGTTNAYAIGTSARAKTTYDSETNVSAERKLGGNAEGYATLNIHGGTFRANAGTTTSRAVSNGGNCTIDGGEFYAMSGTTTADGIYTISGKLKASGVKIEASATTTVYGIRVDVSDIPVGNQAWTGFTYYGDAELNNCEVTATARTGATAYGVYVNAKAVLYEEAKFEAQKTSSSWSDDTYTIYKAVSPIGEAFKAEGKLAVNGGTYTVTAATTTANGIFLNAQCAVNKAAVATPVATIKNAKIVAKTNGTTYAYGIQSYGDITVDGCDITVAPKTTTGYGILMQNKKAVVTNTTIDVKGTTTVYGLYANAAINDTHGNPWVGELELGEGNNVTVAATSGNAAHAITLIATKRNIAKGGAFDGDYAVATTAHVTGGSYKATATGTTSYVLNLSAEQVQGDVKAAPSCTIEGGKFWALATGGTTGICSTNGVTGNILFKGGVYNVNTTLSKHIPDGYEEVPLAEERPEYTEGYRYEVAEEGMHGIYVCKIGSTKYKSLEEALQVVASGQTIVMIANYTMATPGDYVLPAGANLLVPRISTQTAIETKYDNIVKYNEYTTPSAYLTLTFASGVRLDVKGTIQVASLISSKGQMNGTNGAPYGPHGKIILQENSQLILENGAKLYAWGFVTGAGSIDAKKGSIVYESMQIRDWRGGTNTSNIYRSVFPFNQYFFQNIESKIRFRPGSKEIVNGTVNASSSAHTVSATIIGTSDALFLMNDADVSEDTWVQKSYDFSTDYQVYEVNSAAQLSNLIVSGLPIIGSVNSANYTLPLTNNMCIHLLSGKLEVVQDVLLQPGVIMEIDKEARCIMKSGKKMYVQDSEDTQIYDGSRPFNTVAYTPQGSVAGKRTLQDASINMHGTFEFNGYLYTSEHGANIFSTNEDAGTIIFKNSSPSNSNLSICNTGGTIVTKTFTTPQLKNADGETPAFTSTSGSVANDEYAYYLNQWRKWVSSDCFTIDKTNNSNWKYYIKPSEYVQVTSQTPDAAHLHHDAATGNRNFVWDADCLWWEVETTPTAEGYYKSINADSNGKYNYYYYNSSAGCWDIKTITVTWNVNGTNTNYSVGYGTKPQWLGAVPTKTSSSSDYVWRWDGWTKGSDATLLSNDDLPVVTENTTFTAHFYEKYYEYNITFKNSDGTVLDSRNWRKGITPSYDGTPEKAPTVSEIYTFNGTWTPNITTVSGAAEYVANYTSSPRPYEVRFLNFDNSELETKNVNHGSHPTYTGAEPTRTGTPAFSYEFKGWKLQSTGAEYAKGATLPAVAGTQTYIAQYNQVEVRYPVTFVIDPDNHSLDVVKEYKSGQTPSYTGTPTKASTAEYEYTFKAWNPAIVPVVDAGATYTATYTQTKRKYLIQFVDADDFDNTPITSSLVEYGATPDEPDMSNKQTAGYNYTFTGWTPTLASVTGAQTYKAVYTVTPRTDIAYTVKHWQQNINDNDYTEVLADRQMPKGTVGQPTIAEAKTYTGFTAQPFEQALVEAGGVTEINIYYNRNTFTITWMDGDDHIVETDLQVRYGAMPHYDGETPTKTATDQYDYTFTNWAPTLATVTEDATYTAQFSNNTRSYPVTWVDGNGETLTTTNVLYGAAPEYDGATPTKTATAQYTYTFNNHWSPEITDETVITGPMTYTAQFDSELNSYTITWIDGDGETLKTEELDYGLTPAYSGETPTKTATAQYTYTFNSTWYPAVTSVVDDQTYTAQFDATVNKYLIYFVDGDDNTLANPAAADNQWEYGTMPSYTGDTPTKTATAQYTYSFNGWDAIFAAVTEDATYTAQFNSTIREYAITFANVDGYGHSETINVAYGETPVCPVTPVKVDGSKAYEFDHWDNAIVPVTGEATYTAYFKSVYTERTQTITWLNENGTTFDQTIVVYGTVPNHVGPTKAATAEWTYTFTGWTPTPVAATTDATYTATFSQTKNSYTITWLNDDNSLIDETVVEYGVVPTHADPTKAATAEYTYTFTGWTPAIVSVTGNATYKATFSSTKNSYTIHWLNDDNSEIDQTTVEYGVVPTHANPTKAADVQYTYTFTGWTPEVVAVTGETYYQAQFTPTLRQYTVTWVIDGVSTSEQLDYGTTPTHADPSKPATAQYTYTFTGWDKVIVPVAGDVTYTAQFSSTVNKYIITWDINGVTTTEQLEYGETPSHADATKEPTTEKVFTFSGWSPAITTVTQDQTYTAQFNESPRPYTITWVINGVSTTNQVTYGSMPTHEEPEKVVDNCSYPFDSWSPAIVPVSGDATYTAVFSDDCTMNNFFVVFQNYDGTPLYAYEVAGGVTPVYDGEEPKKAGEDFSGWSPKLGAISDHMVYTAQFATPAFEAERIRNGERVSTGTWATMLSEANQAANAGSTIKLHKNVTATNNSTISQNMTIDLNGCTISCTTNATSNTRLFYLNSAVTLTIDDSMGGGMISYTGTNAATYYAFYLNNTNSKLNVNGGIISVNATYQATSWYYDDGNAAAVYLYQTNSTVNIYGGELIATAVGYAYAIAHRSTRYGYANISGGKIKATTAIFQNPSTGRDKLSGGYYSVDPGNNTGWNANITIATGYQKVQITNATVDPEYNNGYTYKVVKAANQTCTVTWKQDDGTQISQTTVTSGGTPTYNGSTPAKAGGDLHQYEFAGWNPTLTAIQNDATYTATYHLYVKVTWMDGNNVPIYSSWVKYGETPLYMGGVVPTKESSATTNYTFNGTWSPEIGPVTKPTTFRAQFDESVRTYTITFANLDGNNTKQQVGQFAYGATPICTETPLKEEGGKAYEFLGWSPAIVPVTADATYTATFSETPSLTVYTITWKDDEGNTIETTKVAEDELPTHVAPVKANTDEYTYTFTGWSPAVVPATADATYQATFSQTKNKYTITFEDYDGTVIQSGLVEYGAAVVAPADPSRLGYSFDGWSPAITSVSGDATYTATYTFLGKVASVTTTANVTTYYTTWDAALSAANSNAGCTLRIYTDIVLSTSQTISQAMTLDLNGCKISYTTNSTSDNTLFVVTASLTIDDSMGGGKIYLEGSGNTNYQAIVANGEGAVNVYGGTIQTNATNTGSSTYAIVVFMNAANSTLNLYGGELIASSNSTSWAVYFSYTQSGSYWNPTYTYYGYGNIYGGKIKSGSRIFVNSQTDRLTLYGGYYSLDPQSNANLTIPSGYAKTTVGNSEPEKEEGYNYKVIKSECIVIWKNYDGTTLETDEKVANGTTPTYDGATPTKPATAQYEYTFTGWSPEVSAATADITYTAQFAETLRSYTITWVDGDGGTLQTGEVEYGQVPAYTGLSTPTKTATAEYSYIFNSTWSPTPYAVDKAQTYTAQFTPKKNKYNITWVDGDGNTLKTDKVEYGETPAYTGETPTKTEDANYTYTFNETWSPAITSVTGDATYTAQFTPVSKETGFYVDIVDVDNSAKTLTLNASGWATSGWPYTVNGVIYGKNSTSGEVKYREADRTLILPYGDKTPGENFTITVKNKSSETVSLHSYTIPQEITSSTTLTTDQSKPIFVKGATLTIDGNISAQNIYVAPDAKLVVNSGKTLTADTVFFRTTPESAAELIYDGTISGKVYYTRIIKSKSGYFQFGLPLSCAISEVRLSNNGSAGYKTSSGWILRYYDEASRANNGPGENWATLDASASIAAGKGYEMFSGVDYYREFYFPVNLIELSNSVSVAYTAGSQSVNNGWNVLVSPLTHTLSLTPKPEDITVNWMQLDGSFEQENPASIAPVKTFAYQAVKAGSISFGESSMTVPTLAPRRRVTAAEEPTRIQWIHLDIANAEGEGDQTSVYSHPTRYEQTYKTGIDVAKQSLTASRAIIYSSHAYGEMAFAGVADSLLESGVALTVYSPATQELTFSLRDNDWLNRMEHVWLIDKETGAKIDLLSSDYSYEAAEGTTRGRFFIQGQFKAPQIATELEPTSDSSLKGREIRKVIINQKIFIEINGRLYDATGKEVKR